MRIKSYLIIILLFNLNSCFLFEEPDLCSESHTCPLTDVEKQYLEEILEINGLDPSLAQYYSVKAKKDLQYFRLNNLGLTSFHLPKKTPKELDPFIIDLSSNKITSDSLFIDLKYWMDGVYLSNNLLTEFPLELCSNQKTDITLGLGNNLIRNLPNEIESCNYTLYLEKNNLCNLSEAQVDWLNEHAIDKYVENGLSKSKKGWDIDEQNCD